MTNNPETIIHLQPSFFEGKEKLLVDYFTQKASAFRYDSGVAAIRLASGSGEMVLLPYQGQQIWCLKMNGRDLTMKSMFTQPRATTDYLLNYGGFLLHCGATAMGVPSREDTHALHGELPNAPYQSAYLFTGQDETGRYIGLGGTYQHTKAFNYSYMAHPRVKLYENVNRIHVRIDIENLANSDMELMYLAHINLRPVDDSRLVYSARSTLEDIRVRTNIPSHVKVKPGFTEFLEQLAKNPEKHHVLSPDLIFDPEVVFYINYLTDGQGWAHSLQVLPDGSADYVRHRPDQLKTGIRWMCRTADQDALGLVLPATAEPEGFLAAKTKGDVITLPGHDTFTCEYEISALNPAQTRTVEEKIENILGRSK